MYVVTVTFTLKDNCFDAFMPLMQTQAENSVALEDGCHYFDIAHQADDPSTVFLYEIYTDRAAFDVHLKSNHYNDFNDKVHSMIEEKIVRCYDQHFSG